MSELMDRLRTVVVTTVTHFDVDGSVNHQRGESHAAYLVDQGIDALTPCGNTGEFWSLSMAEAKENISSVARGAAKRATVIAGVGGSVPDAVDLAKHAERAGADAIMIHEPVHTYVHPAGVMTYYRRIIDAVGVGVVLYKRGPRLTNEIIAELADIDQVVAVKYAVNDLNSFANLVSRVGSRIVWICGTAERWAPFYHLAGAGGFTSGLANFAPRLALQLLQSLRANDPTSSMALRREMTPFEQIRDGWNGGNNIPAVKEAMEVLGWGPGVVREPLCPLQAEDRRSVDSVVAEWIERGLVAPANSNVAVAELHPVDQQQ